MTFFIFLLLVTAFTAINLGASIFAINTKGIVHALYGFGGLICVIAMLLGHYL